MDMPFSGNNFPHNGQQKQDVQPSQRCSCLLVYSRKSRNMEVSRWCTNNKLNLLQEGHWVQQVTLASAVQTRCAYVNWLANNGSAQRHEIFPLFGALRNAGVSQKLTGSGHRLCSRPLSPVVIAWMDVTCPIPLVTPSRNNSLAPIFKYSGCLMNLKRTTAFSPVRNLSWTKGKSMLEL